MIKHIQIDSNGLCNAKCWFCPVAYEGNPTKGRSNMSIETLDKILQQIIDGIGDFISKEELTGYTAHYNEIILHPEFEKILETYKKHKLPIYLFTNGVSLTPDKVDIISKNATIIKRIVFNIPSAKADQWAEFSGMNVKLFDKLLNNLEYAHNMLDVLSLNNKISIIVNGINESSSPQNGGWTIPLSRSKQNNFDDIHGDVAQTINTFKKMFPKFGMGSNIALEDRAGILAKLNILSNEDAIQKNKKDKGMVIGCHDNRIDEWIHISASGDVFICCEDFYFETAFGNIHEKSIKEIWYSKEHKDMIKKSMSDMCTRCSYAKWES